MNETQALSVIKQLIDKSLEKGVLINLEMSNAVAQAYKVLTDKLNTPQ
jgi:hypothetical protein